MKIVTIIGNKEVGKTALFRQLVKHYSASERKAEVKPSPLINHTENLIKIGNNTYKLIDTPSFILSPKTEIEKGIKKQTDNLLKTSDLICWVIDKIDEEEILLKKYLKKFLVPQILIFNKTDLADKNDLDQKSSQ